MKTVNKLTGELTTVEHYSDYFSDSVNEHCEALLESIFKHNCFRIKIEDKEGTLRFYNMSEEQYEKTGREYISYESVNFVKIENFLDVLTSLDRSDDTARNIEKGMELFMNDLKAEWEEHVNSINDSE